MTLRLLPRVTCVLLLRGDVSLASLALARRAAAHGCVIPIIENYFLTNRNFYFQENLFFYFLKDGNPDTENFLPNTEIPVPENFYLCP